jgi:hypothetical protein
MQKGSFKSESSPKADNLPLIGSILSIYTAAIIHKQQVLPASFFSLSDAGNQPGALSMWANV